MALYGDHPRGVTHRRGEAVIEFCELISALKAEPSGRDGWYQARCPAHEDRHPSLSIKEGDWGVVLHCFAGCSREMIIDTLEPIGLWPVHTVRRNQPENPPWRGQSIGREVFDKLNDELISPNNSRVERYLRQRGIEVRVLNDIAHHRSLWHAPTRTTWPAMVACVRDVHGAPIALHRTYLDYHTLPAKAPVEPNRMLLGSARGGAIRLAHAAPKLMIGEGIETVAAAMRMFGLPGWSAVSAGNLANVELPEIVREVIILADNDTPGIRAAVRAAQQFLRQGRQASVVKPSEHNDFNDLLRAS